MLFCTELNCSWQIIITPAAPTPATANTTVPRFEKNDCWFKEPPGHDVECGYVIVPEDHAKPAGKTIKLAVARFKSDAAKPQPDPIVYLEGGPGGSPPGGAGVVTAPAQRSSRWPSSTPPRSSRWAPRAGWYG